MGASVSYLWLCLFLGCRASCLGHISVSCWTQDTAPMCPVQQCLTFNSFLFAEPAALAGLCGKSGAPPLNPTLAPTQQCLSSGIAPWRAGGRGQGAAETGGQRRVGQEGLSSGLTCLTLMQVGGGWMGMELVSAAKMGMVQCSCLR